jgi:subtilisin-like proprotein convertase family protein
VTSVITVGDTGQLAEISVDIELTHTWIGDLTVELTSPAGTSVVLHDGTGSSADDIVGNWPETLTVDGPGSLDDLLGEPIAGDWTLHVVDGVGGDTGTLHAWGLNLMIPAAVTAADAAPAVTRLVGNHPNPFNPQTTVAFDLARGGRVDVGIYDLRGRRVRQLVAGEMPAGRHTVRWDGRDDGGRAVASGVYLCRLTTPDAGHMRKLTLVR